MLTTPPSPAVAKRFAENAPVRPIAAPLLVAQGLGDGLVLPTLTEAFVTSRCAAGQRLDYWTFSGLDHAGLVHPDSPLLRPPAGLDVNKKARSVHAPSRSSRNRHGTVTLKSSARRMKAWIAPETPHAP